MLLGIPQVGLSSKASAAGPADFRTNLRQELYGEFLTNVSGKASAWLDQSGAGISPGPTQATAGQRPVIAAASLNGKAGLTFGPAQVCMQDVVNNLVAAGVARTTYVVAKASSTIGGYIMGYRTGADSHTVAAFNPASSDLYVYSSTGGALQRVDPIAMNGVPIIWEFVYGGAGALTTVKANGVLMTGSAFAGGSAVASETGTAGFTIGEPTNLGAAGFIGNLYSIRSYLGAISNPNGAIVRAWLGNYYAISTI